MTQQRPAVARLEPRELLDTILRPDTIWEGGLRAWLRHQQDPGQLKKLLEHIEQLRFIGQEMVIAEDVAANLFQLIADHGKSWNLEVARKLLNLDARMGFRIAQNGHLSDDICQQIADDEITQIEDIENFDYAGGQPFLKYMVEAGRPLRDDQRQQIRGWLENEELQPHAINLLLKDTESGAKNIQAVLEHQKQLRHPPRWVDIALHPDATEGQRSRAVETLLKMEDPPGANQPVSRALRAVIIQLGTRLPKQAQKLVARWGKPFEISKMLQQLGPEKGSKVLPDVFRNIPEAGLRWLQDDQRQAWRPHLDQDCLAPLLQHPNRKIRQQALRLTRELDLETPEVDSPNSNNRGRR